MRWRFYRLTASQKPSNFRNLLHLLLCEKLFFTILALLSIAILNKMSYPSKDNKRCSLKQIAEAVMLSAMDNKWNDYLVTHFDPGYFKSLDTFLTTVCRFTQVFRKNFGRINEEFLNSENWVSEKEFVSFLASRCETLSQKRDHFGLILTSSFVSETLRVFRKHFKCLHYDWEAYKYLSGFLKNNFKCLENKSNWNSLIHYCRELNRKINNHENRKIHEPWLKPPTPVSSGEDVGSETDDELCECDLIETCSFHTLEYQDIDSEEVKNLSELFNDDTDKHCDQSIEITQSKVISDVSQNDMEKNRTQEKNENNIESNIAVYTTFVSSSEVTGSETTDEIKGRKLKSDTIETGIIKKLGCPDTDTEEVLNLNENFNDTDKIRDETFRMTPSRVMSDVSQKGENEKNKPREIKDDIKNIISSSPIKKIESWYDATSSDDSGDEHASTRHEYYNLLMPDRPYKLEMLGLMKKCETAFDYTFPNIFNKEKPDKCISSSSSAKREESDKSFESEKKLGNFLIESKKKIRTPVDEHKPDSASDRKKDSQHCKNCEGLSFREDYQHGKMAFKKRYGNMNKVTDLFYLNISDLDSIGSDSS